MLGDEETRDRILKAISGPSRKPARPLAGRGGGLLLFAAIGVAALGLSLVGKRSQPPPPPEPGQLVVTSVRGATLDGAPLHRRQRTSEGRIRVVEGGHLALLLASAEAELDGPAEIMPRRDGIALFEGAVTVDGELTVEGSGCEATLAGKATITRFATHVRIDVERGSVARGGNVDACHVTAP